MTETFTDLHCHAATSYDFIWNVPGLKGKYYSQTDIPEKLAAHCIQKAKERGTDTLVGIINFDDTRGEGILQGMRNLRDYEITDRDYCLTLGRNGIYSSFIVGQEVPSDKGHILIVGAGKNIKYRKFEDVVKNARDLQALVIADHPLVELGMAARTMNKIANGNPRFGLREEEIERFREYIDAVEINYNFGKDMTEKQSEVAQRLGIPLIGGSDSHSIKGTLSSGTVMNLDLSSKSALIDSIKKGINEKPAMPLDEDVSLEKMKHCVGAVAGTFLLKAGIVRRK